VNCRALPPTRWRKSTESSRQAFDKEYVFERQEVAPNFNLRREDDFTQPENRGAVVCRALTNRTETPFLAQLLSLLDPGPLETPLRAFLIVG
jgi:hypothetical protein